MWTKSAAESVKEVSRVKATQPIPSEMPSAMGRLIRAVGHDLRNKLGVMKNSIYYLNMRLGHGDEKVQKHLQIMGREIGNANRMVADLMDFALAKEPALQKSDVKAIVAEALSQAPSPGNVEVITDLAESLPLITADPNQLQRAFSNIILNSIQAMPEGGELRITAREQAGFVEVGFSDTGPSTPEESLEGIFDPLSATKEGRGDLGLAVSKRLVEGHGGTIEVTSLAGPFDKLRTGKGTTFTVRLPLLGEGGTKHGGEG